MKLPSLYSCQFLSAFILIYCAAPPLPATGQTTAASLQIDTYAGLTITGAVDTVYSIEYTTSSELSNDWRIAALLKLPTSPHLWFDRAAPVQGKRFYRTVAIAAEPVSNMIWIQPGTFMMGSPVTEVGRNGDEGPQTTVTITRGFWLGKYEVTQQEFLELNGTNPSRFSTSNGYVDGLSRPVETVSLSDARAYCDRLTEQEQTAGRIPTNIIYRLPTEAEWEYACRAQTSTRFNYGEDPGYAELIDHAWYAGNNVAPDEPNYGTKVGGQKPPNPWGLHDMHGNVSEWCLDWWASAYAGGSVIDPTGPDTGGTAVARGGSYDDSASACRSANRGAISASAFFSQVGFRVVLTSGQR